MTKKIFKEEEIPYETLNEFGLTKNMLEDLPFHAMDPILKGRRSTLLPITYMSENQILVKDYCRIRLVRESGEVKVMFNPRYSEANLEQFDEKQRIELEKGNAIFAKLEDPETGVVTAAFYQIDRETNSVLMVPSPLLGNNLKVLLEKFHLTNPEITCLRNGEPLVVYVENDPVTMGIDLTQEYGIRIIAGTEEQWKKSSGSEWSKYSFGINGCWIHNDDGTNVYVKEEDYDEKLWEEQKNAVRQSHENQTHRTL